MEFGKALPYDIRITGSANHGYKVKVGCCECVFSNKEDLKAAFAEYIDDPENMERRYNESNQNTEPEAVAETPQLDDRGYISGNRVLRGPRISTRETDQCNDESP